MQPDRTRTRTPDGADETSAPVVFGIGPSKAGGRVPGRTVPGRTAPGRAEGTPDKRLLAVWRKLGVDRRRTYTPFLVIPYKAVNPAMPGSSGDLGTVRPIPNGEPFWATPYIAVENSAGIGVVAIAGEPNFVHARVFNFGKAASAPTQVDFYWADPSLGLGPAHCNPIGTAWVEVPHGRSVDVRCPTAWIPTVLNGGHECLMVNSSNPMTSVVGSVPGNFDPITQPFFPKLDRHVGQRNITVIEGTAAEPMQLSLTLNNLLPFTTRMTVTAYARRFSVDERLLAGGLGSDLAAQLTMLSAGARLPKEAGIRPVRGDRPWVKVDLGDVTGHVKERSGDLPAEIVRALIAAGGGRDGGEPLATATMQAGEQRAVQVAVGLPGDARVGEVAVVTVQQVWEGWVMGGYTLIVRIA